MYDVAGETDCEARVIPRAIVCVMIVADVVIAVSYLICKQPALFWYWMSAASISGSTLFISK